MDGLLPCPFCGQQPRVFVTKGESLWSHNIVDWFSVACYECDIDMNTCDDEDGARQKWNRRAPISTEVA